MNVVHVIDSLSLGGAERIAVDLVNGLAAEGVQTTICASRADGPLAKELVPDVGIVLLNRRRRWQGFTELSKVLRRSDVVHTHGRSSMRLVAFTSLVHSLDVAHVFHDHSSLNVCRPPGLLAEVIPIRLKVDAFIGVDQRLLRRMARLLPVERVHFVRNFIDPRRFATSPLDVRTHFGLHGFDVVVVMLANLHPPKDHLTFLRALTQLRDDRVAALLIGDTASDPAYVRNVRDHIQRHALSDRVRLTGTRADTPAILRGCDLAVFASRRETGPLAVLEYLASGLPTVTTATGQLVEALAPHEVLEIVPPGDSQALATAVRRLLAHTEPERQNRAQRARELVGEHFSPTSATRRVLDVYADVLSLYR